MRAYTAEMREKLTQILCDDIYSMLGQHCTHIHSLKGYYTVIILDGCLIDIPDAIFATTDYREIRLNVIAEIKDKKGWSRTE